MPGTRSRSAAIEDPPGSANAFPVVYLLYLRDPDGNPRCNVTATMTASQGRARRGKALATPPPPAPT